MILRYLLQYAGIENTAYTGGLDWSCALIDNVRETNYMPMELLAKTNEKVKPLRRNYGHMRYKGNGLNKTLWSEAYSYDYPIRSCFYLESNTLRRIGNSIGYKPINAFKELKEGMERYKKVCREQLIRY